ncbi:MAG: DUF3575 domain-containing protein [Tannerella sp.]|jgi:hypothetical protein|nr:DUF3575 domain-containing protein [Tannerella sp.]
MKKGIFIVLVAFLSLPLYSQHIALKNNLVYDATLTPNLSLEIALAKKITLDLGFGYNPFEFSDGKQFKHWLAQPELRFWMCEKFNGTFFGIHAHGGEFNVANLDLPFDFMQQLKDHRYEGYFYGGGVSIGHEWVLAKHWNLEASIGGGYARVEYDKYECGDCGAKLKSDHYNYFGVTRATLSIIYIFR